MRDATEIPIDSVPCLLDVDSVRSAWSSLWPVVSSIDGLRDLREIAHASGASVDDIRSVVQELAWHGALAFEELMQVDEIDLLDAPDDEPADAEAMPLVRRRRHEDSPLVGAILAFLGTR